MWNAPYRRLSRDSGKEHFAFHGSGALGQPRVPKHVSNFRFEFRGHWAENLGWLVSVKPPVAPLAAIAATAASEASVEAVRERICQLHLEQLLQRERPEGRSSEGWQKILSTAQSAVEARVQSIQSLQDLYTFACRCLKDSHLKDVFRSFVVEDVHDCAVSEEVVHSCLHPTEEHPRFEKDCELFEATHRFTGLRPSPTVPIELPGEQPQFPCSLRAQSCVIELD